MQKFETDKGTFWIFDLPTPEEVEEGRRAWEKYLEWVRGLEPDKRPWPYKNMLPMLGSYDAGGHTVNLIYDPTPPAVADGEEKRG